MKIIKSHFHGPLEGSGSRGSVPAVPSAQVALQEVRWSGTRHCGLCLPPGKPISSRLVTLAASEVFLTLDWTLSIFHLTYLFIYFFLPKPYEQVSVSFYRSQS